MLCSLSLRSSAPVSAVQLYKNSFGSPLTTRSGDTLGAAWGDYDNDGRLDLFVSNYGGGNSLYRNEGGGSFTKVNGVNVNEAANSQGCAWGDYDNDGFLDLLVANRDGQSEFLFRNLGDGSWSKVSAAPLGTDGGDSVGCAWADYNRDGFIDLFVANLFGTNALYRNRGDGNFERVGASGVEEIGPSLTGAWGDFDDDGFPDLFGANGGLANNFLYRNNRDGTSVDL